MTSNGDAMADEFDTVAQWTAEVALDLGPGYHVPAGLPGERPARRPGLAARGAPAGAG